MPIWVLYDLRFFEALESLRAARERDKAMIDSLKTIGIEKGKPFRPDQKSKQILNDAVGEAQAWMDHQYEFVFTPPSNEGTHWGLPASAEVLKELMTKCADPNANRPTSGWREDSVTTGLSWHSSSRRIARTSTAQRNRCLAAANITPSTVSSRRTLPIRAGCLERTR